MSLTIHRKRKRKGGSAGGGELDEGRREGEITTKRRKPLVGFMDWSLDVQGQKRDR